jgi:hypothetical protein
MMYIGTSLGGCLKSLMAGEVSIDEVMFIVTRTMCPTFDKYIAVVKQYYAEGNIYARNSSRYDLTESSLDDVIEMASRLYYLGKIHQPRVFVEEGGFGVAYSHPTEYGNGLWMQVVPTNTNTTPAVVEAYEKYKMLDALTRY